MFFRLVTSHIFQIFSACAPCALDWILMSIFCNSLLPNLQRPTALRLDSKDSNILVFEFWLFWNFFLMAGNMKMNYRNVCATTFTQPRIVLRLRFTAVFIFYQKRSKAENWNLAHFADAPFGMAMTKVLDEWNYPTKNLTSTISIAQSREEVLQLCCI